MPHDKNGKDVRAGDSAKLEKPVTVYQGTVHEVWPDCRVKIIFAIEVPAERIEVLG